MSCAFCYYGIVLISTEILGEKTKPAVLSLSSNMSFPIGSLENSSSILPGALFLVSDGIPGSSNETECVNPSHNMLTQSDYVDLLWTTLAEFPGLRFTFCHISVVSWKFWNVKRDFCLRNSYYHIRLG
jgi:hypothetical protein